MPELILPVANQNEERKFASLSLLQRLKLAALLAKQHFLFYFIVLAVYLFWGHLVASDSFLVGNTTLFFIQMILVTLYLLFSPLFSVALQGCFLKDVDRASPARLSLLKLYLPYGPRLFFIFLIWAVPLLLLFFIFIVLLYAGFIFFSLLFLLVLGYSCLPLLAILTCHLAEHPDSTLVQAFCRPFQIFTKNCALWFSYAAITSLLLSPSLVAAFCLGLGEANVFDASFLEGSAVIVGLGALEAAASVYLGFYVALCYRGGKTESDETKTTPTQVGQAQNADNPFTNA